ncbi:hypothetical protein BDU57DRAFT_597130 [Ampelomyces quisqualis]|uniref:Uncharacterized protein n=1 Tax=Ampelomyces quisqualis TaxID=50730 RepID=A0A6A5QIJ0_AMPQU|nr:hypothetical protein BDU57DRAFT_597130 [Ampelomyces quisqualis]
MSSMKKAATEELDWGGFPPVPPGLESWKPDPDSVARPGTLKDPRFHKDPFENSRSRAARKQFGYHIHHSSEVARSLSPASSAQEMPVKPLTDGKWPVQMPRGYHPEQYLSPSKPTIPSGGAVQSSADGVMEVAPTRSDSAHADSTMKSSIFSSSRVPPPKKDNMPAWAGPLEKALAEDTSRNQPGIGQPAKKSLPPHLRVKQPNVPNGHKDASQQQSRASKDLSSKRMPTDPHSGVAYGETNHSSSTTLAKTDDRWGGNSLSNQDKASNKLSGNERDMNGPVQMGESQNDEPSEARSEKISGSLHAVKLAGCNGYIDQGHYLKISLVLAMERQLLEHELQQLSSQELEARMLKTSSIHEAFWQSQNGNGKITHDEMPAGSPVTGLGHVSST